MKSTKTALIARCMLGYERILEQSYLNEYILISTELQYNIGLKQINQEQWIIIQHSKNPQNEYELLLETQQFFSPKLPDPPPVQNQNHGDYNYKRVIQHDFQLRVVFLDCVELFFRFCKKKKEKIPRMRNRGVRTMFHLWLCI